MKAYFLLFDNFSGYELVFPAFVLRKGEIITVGFKNGPALSEEKLKIAPDVLISEIDVDDVDIFIIPGGNPLPYVENSDIKRVLEALNEKKKIIAAICGGPILFANTNLLENRRFTAGGGELPETWQKLFTTGDYVKEDIVIDDNIITAKGQACAKFAITIGKKMGVFESEEEEKRVHSLLRDIK